MKNKKESVALSSVGASIALTLMKFIVGMMTGSMGIMSEAAHSFLDFGAAMLTYMTVRVSDNPPDLKHQYGHGKLESVSAFIETGLLFLTSIWIIYEAVQRLLFRSVEVEATWYAFVVIIVSIIIDISRSKALSKVAKETGSQALEADALHFSSDILSSGVVLIGLVFVALGVKGADAIAAIGVAIFVIYAGYRLGKRTLEVLLDTAPVGLTEKISEIARKVDGVIDITKIRIRPAGISIFMEMELVISRRVPFEKVEGIITDVKKSILTKYPEADMTISAKPIALDDETITERVHILASNQNIPIHDIVVHDTGKNKNICFDLEVDDALSVEDAHKIASHLEKEIIRELGQDVTVNTHIEPFKRHPVKSLPVTPPEQKKIEEIMQNTIKNIPKIKEIHDITLEKTGKIYFVSLHAIFADKTSLEEAHNISSRLEYLVRQKLPAIKRVVVHTEPTSDK